jgi:enamine deaminase RidA (YjgF/YER057c/UK114 family)
MPIPAKDFPTKHGLLAMLFLTCSYLAAQSPAQGDAKNLPAARGLDIYHAGPWEKEIGYSQAVRSGNMLYVSGTVGANSKGEPADLDGQMKKAYAAIQKTLAHYNTDLSHVVMERILYDRHRRSHSQPANAKAVLRRDGPGSYVGGSAAALRRRRQDRNRSPGCARLSRGEFQPAIALAFDRSLAYRPHKNDRSRFPGGNLLSQTSFWHVSKFPT